MDKAGTVVFVSQSANLYGSERALLALLEHRPKSITPVVVTAREGPLHSELRKLRVESVPLAFNGATLLANPLWHWRFYTAFKAILKTHNPLAVVVIYEGNVPLIIAACKASGMPVFRILQRPVERGRRLANLQGRAADGLSFLLSSAVICGSPVLEKQLRQAYHFAGRPRALTARLPVRSITPQIKDPLEIRKSWNIPPADKIVGQFSRLHPVKGLETMLGAAQTVLETCSDVWFVVGGDSDGTPGANEYRAHLFELARTLRLWSRFRFLGFVDDVLSAMNACDVIAMPSLSEGVGISCLEALLVKKPVVGTDIDGLGEIIARSNGGMLIKPRDAEGLASALITLLSQSDLRHQLGENGKDWVVRHCAAWSRR